MGHQDGCGGQPELGEEGGIWGLVSVGRSRQYVIVPFRIIQPALGRVGLFRGYGCGSGSASSLSNQRPGGRGRPPVSVFGLKG